MHINLSDNNFDQLILFAIGLIFIIVGYLSLKKNNKLYSKGLRTEGIVFAVERNDGFRFGKQADVNWYVTIRYVTVDKLWITKRYEENSDMLSFKEGDKVKVIYDPIDPEQFILDGSASKYGPLLFLTAGIVMTAASILTYTFNINLNGSL